MKNIWRVSFLASITLLCIHLYTSNDFARFAFSIFVEIIALTSFAVSIAILIIGSAVLFVNAFRLTFAMNGCTSDETITANLIFTVTNCLSIFILTIFRDVYESTFLENGYAQWFDQYGLFLAGFPILIVLISLIADEANDIKEEYQRYKRNLNYLKMQCE